MNNVNYATIFDSELRQKYSREMLTSGLNTEGVNFVGGNTIRIPFMTLGGYKDHGRDGGFNRQAVQNDNITRTLAHDRNVEFFVDSMDVDETNQVLAATNLTNVFETEHAIPEMDAFRISRLYNAAISHSGATNEEPITKENVLEIYDRYMEQMDEAEVPQNGRILYVTPAVNKMLAQSTELNRIISVMGNQRGSVNRAVRLLDEVEVVVVPSSRMRTTYDFSDGFRPIQGAGQINMILIHPSSVIAVNKHSYIKLWPPGSHTMGDGYLYQNRQYGDLFLLDTRAAGVRINVTH
ncbi:MAG: capsid protein [Defluviitaleaceae bacterium]|nr:capsid protein [Defluviitaleaceae bacterium]